MRNWASGRRGGRRCGKRNCGWNVKINKKHIKEEVMIKVKCFKSLQMGVIRDSKV